MDKTERLEWFRDAKFGMFIHWGPYAHFDGAWNDKTVPPGEQAEWIMKYRKIPVEAYREHTRSFNPTRFDAREWVKIAKNAGMKYIVITAKHHDGFAMYHSTASPYNIVDWTPFDRDPLKELSEACAEEGIRFCVYYSHREDWDHPGAYGNGWDYDNDWSEENWQKDLYRPDGNGRTPMMGFEEYLEAKAIPQMRELMTGYGPIGLVWFDRGIYTHKQGMTFVNLVHDLQPECLVNSRVGHYYDEQISDYQSLGDNRMPIGGIDEYWESPQTLNGTWGYNPYDELWKSPEEVLDRLVKIVSCGGNYLLNVGPTGDGVIPEESVRIITEAGQWVNRNGESIYGASPSPFSELPFGYCTVKGEKLFVHVRDWQEDGSILLPGLRSTIKTGYFLLDKDKTVTTASTADGVTISLPAEPVDIPMTVVVLELADTIQVDPPVVVQADDGTITLDYLNAITTGNTQRRYGTIGRFHISKWTGPGDTVSWNMEVDREGTYAVRISYAATDKQEGRGYTVSIGNDTIGGNVEDTGKWYQYGTFAVGTFDIVTSGRYTLTVRPESTSAEYLMYLQSMTLSPQDR